MKFFLKNIPNREIGLFALLLFLIIALPLTVFLGLKRQDIRSKAEITQGPASLFLNSTDALLNPDQTFTVDLYLDPGGKNVEAVEAYLNYPTDLLEIKDVTVNTQAFPNTVKKEIAQNGNIDLSVSK